jgi:hypothetical protein
LWAGKKALTENEIAKLPIPLADLVWVLIHMMSKSNRRLFVCDCMERDCTITSADQNIIEASRKYARGKISYKKLLYVRPWSFIADFITYCADNYDSDAAHAIRAVTLVSYNDFDREWQVKRALKYIKGRIGITKKQSKKAK